MGGGRIKTGGLKKHVLEQIVELRKAQDVKEGNAVLLKRALMSVV